MLHLTQQEKDEIFEAIAKNGLDPKQFKWKIRTKTTIRVYKGAHFPERETELLLYFKASQENYKFTFESYEGGYRVSVFPSINNVDHIFELTRTDLIKPFKHFLSQIV